jgi:quinate/shikimate dehydrogenase (NAD+)
MTGAGAGSSTAAVRLGLIGDNIKRSRSPDLHRFAGKLCGIEVSYDLFIPVDRSAGFETVFAECRAEGMRGVNVTYPYKERVVPLVSVSDPLTRAVGAVNTVVFRDGNAIGHNTDCTGFVAAYRAAFADRHPGTVVLVGAGGVGRAVAFGLSVLGVSAIRIVDRDAAKSAALAAALAARSDRRLRVETNSDVAVAMADADGIINCTPIGMVGHPGSSIPAACLPGRSWGFDAVYTPVETRFKQEAEAAGVRMLSGFELFFHQGIQAFEIFTGRRVEDVGALRRMLEEPSAA